MSHFDSNDAIALFLSFTDEIELRDSLRQQFALLLIEHPELVAGLNRLVLFASNVRIPSSFLVYLDRDRDALPSLLQVLSIDSPATDWFVNDPDSFDWLRLSAGQAVPAEQMKDTLLAEVRQLDEESQVQATLRRFRRRETLRVICAFTLHDMPYPKVSQQLAWIAESVVAAALSHSESERKRERRARALAEHGIHDLTECIAILGLGSLGGEDLDFEEDLELIVLRDSREWISDPLYHLITDELQRLLQQTRTLVSDSGGAGFRISFPFDHENRFGSDQNPLPEYDRWMQAIENEGWTSSKLGLMKGRFLAGSPRIANRFFDDLPSLVYHRYLNQSDIIGIGAIMRTMDRIELASIASGGQGSDISTWVRRKREIALWVQFLQLVHGGEIKKVQSKFTLTAIELLDQFECISDSECFVLRDAFIAIGSKIISAQHRRLGVNGKLSANGNLLVAAEMKPSGEGSPKATLIHQTFRGAPPLEITIEPNDALSMNTHWQNARIVRDRLQKELFVVDSCICEETDLVLDPNPNLEWVEQILSRYGFKRTDEAFRALSELAREEISLLSTHRCRVFLSAIAAQLLDKIRHTPDPDLTLENLVLICRSLGGKGILWELFSSHEASLDLTIKLCGSSPTLVSILTSNPGMIDELLDSLMLNRLPTEQQLTLMLHELCRGADDVEPIVHSFKNARHLNVGVRDILGKESITDTHRALADIADVCLQQIIDSQHTKLMKRFGLPMKLDGTVCRFSVVANGKLGGREPNYHSDVSFLIVYESVGATQSVGALRVNESIPNEYYFHQLAVKVGQAINRSGRMGRLYEMKHWTISDGRNASLAWTLYELEETIGSMSNSTAIMQQLCSARCIAGTPQHQEELRQFLLRMVASRPWTDEDSARVRSGREELLVTAGKRNLKRGIGGTIEVEILTQVMTLRNVAKNPGLFVQGTVESIERLRGGGLLPSEDADRLREGYNFLRGIESGLRLMNTQARHDLPESEVELARLAYVLNLNDRQELLAKCDEHRSHIRSLFERFV